MAPRSPCNTDRRKEIIPSIITDRSQAPIKRSPLYERLSENLSFAKLRSAVTSSSSSDNVRWALGLFGTNEAAVRALKNGRTGFRTWDALERKTAANQIGTLSRWNKGEQTA